MEIFDIQELTFRYSGSGKPCLENINIKTEPGEFLLVCGPSGCGKTTLLKNMKTVLRPFGEMKGKIFYRGTELDRVPMRTQTEEIGYVFQRPDDQIVTDKVWHEMAFEMENLGYPQEEMKERISEMCGFFGINEWYHKDVNDLSGGQKQILSLASVMAVRPEVLILDEPTSGLDPIAAEHFLQNLEKIHNELGTSVIITEHRLDQVFPMADRVMVMDKGKCIALDRPSRVPGLIQKNSFYAAMPVTARIYTGISENSDCDLDNMLSENPDCPLTVLEERKVLNKILSERNRRSFPHRRNKENVLSAEEKKRPDSEEKHSSEDLNNSVPLKNSGTVRNTLMKEKNAGGEKIPAVDASEVWFRYEKNTPDVLKGLNLTIPENKLICILGGNGAGKSTMLSVLSGIGKPHHGKVKIFGKDIKKWDKNAFYGKTAALLPQDPQTVFLKDSVRDDLLSVFEWESVKLTRKEKEEKVVKISEETGISHLLDIHPYDLSGGEQQRAAICKVLLRNPKILFMDEPTKGFDNYYKEKLGRLLKKLMKNGMTVVMVSHDIEFCAEYADLCGMFFDGNVISLKPPSEFFGENTFYTTVSRMITRGLADRDRNGNIMITPGDVIREFSFRK